MTLSVRIKTGCKDSSVTVKDGIYFVNVKARPFKNSANLELIELLSNYFDCTKSSIKILRGLKSKDKVVLLKDED